ncbi:MAG: DinB family protein [Bacteroidetes bacterium]|nr:DinB family protein [Bacteroidota bacterium]
MKPVDKHQLLDNLEEMVNSHIQTAVEQFQNMHQDLLNRPAADGGWSIAQCLEHLNRYGDYYLPLIGRGIAIQRQLVKGGKFKSGFIGAYFTRMMNPDTNTGRKKIKAFKAYSPVPELDAHAVVAEFIRQQEELLLCVRRARMVDLNIPRIPISILKLLKLKMGDVLQFLIMHDERHVRQAKRNLVMPMQARSLADIRNAS